MLKESMLAHNHSMLQLGLTTFRDTITRTIYNWSKFIFKLHTHECSAGVSRSPLIWLHSATLLPGQPTKFWVCHKQEAQIHNYLFCPIQQGQGKDLVRGSGGRLACFWLFILGIVGAQVLRSLYSNTFPVSWGENGGLDMWWSLSDTCENNKGVFNSEKSVHTHAPTPKSTSRSGYRKPSQQNHQATFNRLWWSNGCLRSAESARKIYVQYHCNSMETIPALAWGKRYLFLPSALARGSESGINSHKVRMYVRAYIRGGSRSGMSRGMLS